MTGRRDPKRCAIYTRKSTEDGLEQDFNSLHAQREACAAYIRSQQHEGWRLVPDAFDDGGYSGGTMERPALARLLDAVKAGVIDVVVVYKVDRLTRSLMDFTRMVALFDEHAVSFVSVTQQFNTMSSMGRLTLNVLLSFAQFEREVTGERIRDKIAASKKKGLWMGGTVPLSYDAVDRRLVVNPAEAETVRRLFRLYLECGAVRPTLKEAARLGLRTKRRWSFGRETGAIPFSRGHLYRLLANPVYIGRVAHKGATYPGQHEAIVDEALFESVQRQLHRNAAKRRSVTNARCPSLLAGLVYDETGDSLTPIHANKKGRRYRYYVSRRLVDAPNSVTGGWRLPAARLEDVVIWSLGEFLDDKLRLVAALELHDAGPEVLVQLANHARSIGNGLAEGSPEHQHEVLRAAVRRATIHPDRIDMRLHRGALDPSDSEKARDNDIAITTQVQFRRRGVETKIILRAGKVVESQPDEKLITCVARAHRWFDDLAAGRVSSVRELARREGVHEGDVSRVLPLAFLAPDIVEAILNGLQPVELTLQKARRLGPLPLDWTDQRRRLGFDA